MQRVARWMEVLLYEVGHAARSLRRDPRFAAMVILTLSLGIGANAALFSMADRLFFREPSGVANPGTLRRLYARTNWTVGGVTEIIDNFGFAQFGAVRTALAERVDLAAYTPPDSFPVGEGNAAIKARGVYATSNLLPLLGAHPLIGRTFTPEEDRMGAGANVAVIGASLWRNAFNSDPAVLGRVVSIARQKMTVVGVMADGFTGIDLDPVDVWLPIATFPPEYQPKLPWYQSWRFGHIVRAVGRVRPGVSNDLIDTIATTAFRRGELANVDAGPDTATIIAGPLLAALGPSLTPRTENAIASRLAGVVVIVLLIACANVANLLLVRSMRRQRELAVRVALGISRSRLLMLPTFEALLLSLAAAAIALVISAWGGAALAHMVLQANDARAAAMDWRVGVFTVVIAIFTGLLGSVLPTLRMLRPKVVTSLKAGVREGGGQGARLRSALLISQAALSVVLLVGAGLFVRSLQRARGIDLGMDMAHLLNGHVYFYDDNRHVRDNDPHMQEITDGMRDVSAQLAALPSVRATALASNTPMQGWMMIPAFLDDGRKVPRVNNRDPALIAVTRSYFAATGMTLVAGRTFNGDDVPGSEPVVVVNEATARAYWPGENPVGKCLTLFTKDTPCSRVIGVVHDAHYETIVEKPVVGLFVAVEQRTKGLLSTPTALIVRVAPGAESTVAAAMRRLLRKQFPNADPPLVAYSSDKVDAGLKPWRLGATLFTMFGALALIVAAIGAYSVIAYSVSQRAHEIGVRIALGARVWQVVRLVMGEGVRAVSIGIVLGVAASLALGRVVASMLYDTSPRDPVVFAGVIATLAAGAIAAASVPAWKAARIDPARALREE